MGRIEIKESPDSWQVNYIFQQSSLMKLPISPCPDLQNHPAKVLQKRFKRFYIVATTPKDVFAKLTRTQKRRILIRV